MDWRSPARVVAAAAAVVTVSFSLSSANPVPSVIWGPASAEDSLMQGCAPSDAVLVVYNVMMYSWSNGELSTEWEQWQYADSIELHPSGDCTNAACMAPSSSFTRFTVKAAADNVGLYLLVTAQDNSWLDSAGTSLGDGDHAVFYLEQRPASAVLADSTMIIPSSELNRTYATQVLRIPLSHNDSATLSYYDDNLWSWQTLRLSRAQLATLYHISYDLVAGGSYSRSVEVLIPWMTLAKGLPVATQISGKRMAFWVGYDDRDLGDSSVARLRWRPVLPYDSGGEEVIQWRGELYCNPLAPPEEPMQARATAATTDPGTPLLRARHSSAGWAFSCSLRTPGEVQLTIVDLRGGVVRTLAPHTASAGEHTVPWDGRDDSGRRVQAGTYVARLHSESGTVQVQFRHRH